MKVNQKGFTLIELLIVIAILGILAVIAIVNLLDAQDRAKQRATVGDMRAWGTALGSYYVERSVFPATAAIDVVRAQLVPYETSTLHNTDHWKNPFEYERTNTDPDTYTFVSIGKSVRTFPPVCVNPSTARNYDLDIVLISGIFVCAP